MIHKASEDTSTVMCHFLKIYISWLSQSNYCEILPVVTWQSTLIPVVRLYTNFVNRNHWFSASQSFLYCTPLKQSLWICQTSYPCIGDEFELMSCRPWWDALFPLYCRGFFSVAMTGWGKMFIHIHTCSFTFAKRQYVHVLNVSNRVKNCSV